jgi:hypothetical protein
MKMRTLHLTVKKKWFDMELSGEKTEEYRAMTPYWEKRLYHKLYPRIMQYREYDTVQVRNGYAKNAPVFERECLGVTAGMGNPEWGAPDYPVFIIKLGKIL